MKRRYKMILTAVGVMAVLVLMFVWLTGNLSCEGKISPGKLEVKGEPPAGRTILEVSAVTVPVALEAVGTVAARDRVEISSRIMAGIIVAAADSGDRVEKGQTLFVLDSRDAEARLAQAREALASAEATLEKVSLDAGRIERLYEKKAATKQEFDRAGAALKTARAAAESAKAMVREAEVSLSYTRIDSPLTGAVIDRVADPGDTAIPGKPLMSIYNPSSLRLEASIAEQFRRNVTKGQIVKVSLDSAGAEFEGGIEEIVPASQASSRSFLVRVSVPATEAAYPGMYGKIWLPVGEKEAVLIPPDALQRVGQLEMVTVVENGVTRSRAVKTGKTYPEGMEVLSGLVPGELIVLP